MSARLGRSLAWLSAFTALAASCAACDVNSATAVAAAFMRYGGQAVFPP